MLIESLMVALLPTIWIVDAANGPGTNFTDIAAAVAAAQSGDTVLVRAGTYSGFTISGKSLTIRGAGATSTHCGRVTVVDTVAGQPCYLGSLGIDGPQGALLPVGALDVQAHAVVTIADCRVLAGTFDVGARVLGELHASRCEFEGGITASSGTTAGPGVMVGAGARFAAQDCMLRGGFGNIAAFPSPSGGTALQVNGGFAMLSDSACQGGSAFGIAGAPNPNRSGDGIQASSGAFVRFAGDASVVLAAGGALSGVPSGVSVRTIGLGEVRVHGPVPLPNGVLGNVTFAPAQPQIEWTGTLLSSGELVATQPTTLSIHGDTPGAVCALSIDSSPTFLPNVAPWLVGELIVLPNPSTAFGTLDASGQFGLTGVLQLAAPALVDIPLHAQGAMLVSTEVRLTGAVTRVFR